MHSGYLASGQNKYVVTFENPELLKYMFNFYIASHTYTFTTVKQDHMDYFGGKKIYEVHFDQNVRKDQLY